MIVGLSPILDSRDLKKPDNSTGLSGRQAEFVHAHSGVEFGWARQDTINSASCVNASPTNKSNLQSPPAVATFVAIGRARQCTRGEHQCVWQHVVCVSYS
jgi:hypothetical protein